MIARILETKVIRIDGGTQPREQIDQDYVAELAEAIEGGEDVPPVDVFCDGAAFWLADGFHRYFAHQKAKKKITCNVHEGLQRDAVLFSVGANKSHGKRRTNADKRRAVLTLLNDKEWSEWSDKAIADRVGVAQSFTTNVRASLISKVSDNPPSPPAPSPTPPPRPRTYINKHGKQSTMNTANIGRSSKPRPTARTEAASKPSALKRADMGPLIKQLFTDTRGASLVWPTHRIQQTAQKLNEVFSATEGRN